MGRTMVWGGLVELQQSEAEYFYAEEDGDRVSGTIEKGSGGGSRESEPVTRDKMCHKGRGMVLVPRFLYLWLLVCCGEKQSCGRDVIGRGCRGVYLRNVKLKEGFRKISC